VGGGKSREGGFDLPAATLEDRLEIANWAVAKEDLICITGSFYLVEEAKKVFAKMVRQEAAEAAAATARFSIRFARSHAPTNVG